MKSVKIAELKDRLSEHLRAVEKGAEVIVTDRDRPIARIIPVEADGARLIIDAPKVSFESVRTKKWRATGWIVSSTELLAEERSER